MRSTIAISLVLLLLLNLFGFYVAFVIHQNKIQEQVSEEIESGSGSHYKAFSITRKDFEELEWTKAGREFRRDGKLYDVANIVISGKLVRLFVKEDEQETELVTDFVSVVNQQSDKDMNSSPLKILLEHFLKDFNLNHGFCFFYPGSTYVAFEIHSSDSYFPSYFCDYPSPPPKLS